MFHLEISQISTNVISQPFISSIGKKKLQDSLSEIRKTIEKETHRSSSSNVSVKTTDDNKTGRLYTSNFFVSKVKTKRNNNR